MSIPSLRILAALCCVGSMAAHAADPASGTLSTANPTITYESGPFTGSNPNGECDDLFCDHFALTLDLAGVPTTSSVRITTSWITPGDDFDIYWMNGAVEVDHSAEATIPGVSGNPEVMTVSVGSLASITYDIQIVPFTVTPGSTTTTVIEFVAGGGGGGGDNPSSCTVPGVGP